MDFSDEQRIMQQFMLSFLFPTSQESIPLLEGKGGEDYQAGQGEDLENILHDPRNA
jgi:hypothetical protein